MRHSVFAGGKRLRPILCMESARMVSGAMPEGVDELGAAIEMLHTYSLVHDDLPALDNDDLRRGRPTCHKAFGEATAILAGDALQTQAYEVMARLKCPAEARVRIIGELAHGTGTIDGMIGGQVVDLESEHVKPDLPTLEYIHRAKTGALIVSSLLTGCYYVGAKPAEVQRVREFGRAAGLAFQIADDILDVTQTQRTTGQDRRQRSGGRKGHLSGALRTGEGRRDGGATDPYGVLGAGQLRRAGQHSKGNCALPGGTQKVGGPQKVSLLSTRAR